MQRTPFLLGIAAALTMVVACSPVGVSSTGNGGDGGSAGSSNGGTAGNNQGGGGANQGGDNNVGGFESVGPGTGGNNPTGGTTCATDPAVDDDGDGFSEEGGDCNDCDANVNPGAIEVKITEPNMDGMIPDPADEDCDGTVDNVPAACDQGLALGDTDGFHGANAIELCQQATANDKKWGVLQAKYVRANGSAATPPNPLQYGLLDNFGPNVNVQGGSKALALSSGHARLPGQNGSCDQLTCMSNSTGTPPPGFPQQVCNASPSIFDDVALDLKIRSPKNATGYSFNFKFHSFEYAEWVCTSYNDQFIALVNPAPVGSVNGNISFDSKNNPVSVNIGFFDVCDQSTLADFASFCSFGCPSPPVPYCPSGPDQLVGTGFDSWSDAGGTSWLKTQAPLKGGDEINIRFTIWDAGDQALDSTVLVDNFQWIANGGTVAIGTVEIPDPK